MPFSCPLVDDHSDVGHTIEEDSGLGQDVLDEKVIVEEWRKKTKI